jgi:hypothetical protein
MLIKVFEEFVSTPDGYDFIKPFRKKFNSHFFYDEQGCRPTYADGNGTCYDVPETETMEELKAVIKESMKQGKDLVAERYKDFKSEPFNPNWL